MASTSASLFITFDGLSDPLVQSQILPYLIGISQEGYSITIISCEKKNRFLKEEENIRNLINSTRIKWKYIFYDENGGPLSRIKYTRELEKLAKQEIENSSIKLIHCRSYLASLIGLKFKQKFGIPFLFDMRGFWADERIDGGIWDLRKIHHRLFYKYFKKKEADFYKYSNAVVSLTNAAVADIDKRFPNLKVSNKTTVIPCCTDTNLFKPASEVKLVEGIHENDHVLVYTGSIGTWYYTKEMIDCFLVWKKEIANLKLLILTRDSEALNQVLEGYPKDVQKVIFSTASSRQDVPKYLALAKASIFFIKPAYSKIASSPTKMAECWAMNLPIITNAGIGDNDLYFNKHKGGILLDSFDEVAYKKSLKDYQNLMHTNTDFRSLALNFFDNKEAIKKYTMIYNKLSQGY